jgi:hypothetical protein
MKARRNISGLIRLIRIAMPKIRQKRMMRRSLILDSSLSSGGISGSNVTRQRQEPIYPFNLVKVKNEKLTEPPSIHRDHAIERIE